MNTKTNFQPSDNPVYPPAQKMSSDNANNTPKICCSVSGCNKKAQTTWSQLFVDEFGYRCVTHMNELKNTPRHTEIEEQIAIEKQNKKAKLGSRAPAQDQAPAQAQTKTQAKPEQGAASAAPAPTSAPQAGKPRVLSAKNRQEIERLHAEIACHEADILSLRARIHRLEMN